MSEIQFTPQRIYSNHYRYICRDCGAVFTERPVEVHIMRDEFGDYRSTSDLCPFCGGDDIEETRMCDSCGDFRARGDFICPACRKQLAGKFEAFMDSLTEEEGEQLEEWLEQPIQSKKFWEELI